MSYYVIFNIVRDLFILMKFSIPETPRYKNLSNMYGKNIAQVHKTTECI